MSNPILLPAAQLVPLHFGSAPDDEFLAQTARLRSLLHPTASLLDPRPLGSPLPDAADAVVLPQVLGEAYRRLPEIKAIPLPLLVITSEFGTVSMWDWEIGSYLRAEGLRPLAPYHVHQAHLLCRALAVKRQLRLGRFLVYQDDPGEGFQASIFKRFYWWEEECTRRILDHFGLAIERRSFRALGAAAKAIPDSIARQTAEQRPLPAPGLSDPARLAAIKLYLALKAELAEAGAILGCGINCLNESHFSDSTPCLAWNWLYQDLGLTWGCEGDTMAMLTHHILHQTLQTPIMMTNMYPFLMGQAALKHERIVSFPSVPDPDRHVLVAHCGYLGVLPQPFATEWNLKPKVLAIVDPNASAIDARLPEGPITLAKLHPKLDRLSLVEGSLEGYAQYPGSDCLNGAVLKLPDGHRFLQNMASHHYLLMTGHQRRALEWVSPVLNLDLEIL